MKNQTHNDRLKEIIDKTKSTKEAKYNYFHENTFMVPSRKEVISIIKDIQSVMFPAYFVVSENAGKSELEVFDGIFIKLKREITKAFAFCNADSDKQVVDTEELAYDIMSEIPTIKEKLIKDVQAIYEGDPASRAAEEVILSYPGFYAISIYRIAHEFYKRNIPYMARLMTEFAHEKTGIDIHAGATIGEYFFIDHGTGIVIGETTTIGDRVKIYQGVTLGAKSFELDSDGNPVKGIKRHPDIGNDCVIYANATILGGNTKIGDGATIGANVWITSSVEEGKTVYYTPYTKN